VTRVVLIGTSGRERDHLEDLLEAADAQVVGSAPDLESASEELSEAADVAVVLDSSGELAEQLVESPATQELARNINVVLITRPQSAAWMSQVIRAGLRGVLPLHLSAEQLRAALGAVAHGFAVQPREARLGRTADTIDLVEALTTREKEVLQLLAQGRGNKDIAARLKISEHTVKFHVASILGKLGAATRTEAVSVAMRRGLILF
jgi:two-component system, NarL family, response regulator YdfI